MLYTLLTIKKSTRATALIESGDLKDAFDKNMKLCLFRNPKMHGLLEKLVSPLEICQKMCFFCIAPKRSEDDYACLEILKCVDFWKN